MSGWKQCYNCGGWGHMSRECPSERKGAGKGGKDAGKGKKRRAREMHSKTADGREICFQYQRGTCSGSCGRVHVCTGCLGNRPSKECPTFSR